MLLAFLLALQTASAREAPPVLQFPTPGLDDSAAYEGYTARIYRDSRGNSVEIYIEGKTGRVVHLWADGLNESVGFTAREEGGQKTTAAVAFDAGKATVGATGGRRWGRDSLGGGGRRPILVGELLPRSVGVRRGLRQAGAGGGPDAGPAVGGSGGLEVRGQ